MSSNPQSDKHKQAPATNNQNQSGDEQQEFTPEQLRKAARAQIIIYVVMALLIVSPFIFMWLRK